MSDDKTEQPTPKRLREAREKGDVCKSQDISHAVSVLGLGVYLVAAHESIFETVMSMTTIPMTLITRPYEEALPMALGVMGSAALRLVAPVVGLVMGLALLSNLAQVGVLFAFKAALPKLENISPAKWFKKTFSLKNGVEFLKNVLKVGVLCLVVKIVLEDHIRTLFTIQKGSVWTMWTVIGSTVQDLLLLSAGAFCGIAGLDYLFQKWQYTKNHMMSKDEVKREYKESEGDPHIKSKRKQLHQELLSQNTLGNVRKAKVLVTNPTHYAVALDYEKGKTPLPVILAKGEGHLAQRMIDVAREEGIPIMRNVPLARSLFSEGTENSYIPKELIGPVAEVLRWVQSLERR